MSVTLLKVAADIELALASAVSVGATSATLSSASDDDGVALAAGKYGFTIDGDNSAKEYIVCDLSGTALTNITNISRQGASSAGFANYHRVGATVTITDWAIFSRVVNNLDGTTGFDAGTPLNYDAEPSYADPLTIPTVQFVLDTASGGAVTFDATVIAGDAGENVADGDWVYYNTTDGEWYKTDADDPTKSLNVQIGKARGAGTNGNAIVGGIFIAGLEKEGTYVAGTTYYIGNTAGELSSSAGTYPVIVGVGDANGDLVVRTQVPSQVNTLWTSVTAGATITGSTLPVPVYQNTTDNEYYACDGNDLAALKFQGFAVTNGTDGNSFYVQMSGVVGGFTGLDEGVAYYLSDTVGTIQNTPGTYTVLVGVAISPTQLLIQKGRRHFTGDGGALGTASGSLAVDCGFRPTVVRIYAGRSTGTVVHSVLSATWANGVYSGTYVAATDEGNGAIFFDSAGNIFTFTITSVTNTGCTITWTETGAVSTGAVFSYEVEGEF